MALTVASAESGLPEAVRCRCRWADHGTEIRFASDNAIDGQSVVPDACRGLSEDSPRLPPLLHSIARSADPTKQERTAAHIAKRILSNTRKRFSALHAEALESEFYMATPTSSNGLNTAGSAAVKIQIGRHANVESLGQKPVADNLSISAMGVNSQVGRPTAKPVDFKTITGSYPGDHRSKPGDVAKATLDKAADNGGPRKDVGQFRSSRFESEPTTQSFAGNLADSDAGN